MFVNILLRKKSSKMFNQNCTGATADHYNKVFAFSVSMYHARIPLNKDQHNICFSAMLIRTKSSWISNTLNTANNEHKSYNYRSLILLSEVGYIEPTMSLDLVKTKYS